MSQAITEEVLRELGFLPDGKTEGEFGLHIWDVNQEVVELDDENNMQLVFSVPNQELFLEAYDAELRTVSVTQIPTPTDREAFVTLLKGLGAYREQLSDHVSRELKKYMPSCPSVFGTAVIDFIFVHRLFRAECPDSPESSVVITWAANAPEQIGEFIAEQGRKIGG